MDIIDQAQALALRATEAAVRQARTAEPRRDADSCTECGDDIPAARRAALGGTDLCAFCAGQRERRK
jgi:RNA polymerase-binding transcription factor DksA